MQTGYVYRILEMTQYGKKSEGRGETKRGERKEREGEEQKGGEWLSSSKQQIEDEVQYSKNRG